LASGLLSLSAAAVLALNGAGGAVAAPTANDGDAGAPVTAHIVTDTGSADYWTPERMRSAANGEILASKALQRSQNQGNAAEPVERGKASTVPGLLPAESKANQDPTASRKGTGDAAVPHAGKVFFTLGGTNYVCSGNSVASGNKSTVSTAGHCLHEAPGSFASNFVFVPAYKDGAAPYGKWTAKTLYAPTEWTSNGNMQYDTGFAVVHSLGSQLLADVVGASGLQFNVQRGLTYKAFGYPAAAPFDGQSLESCSGKANNDPFNPQFNSQGINCNMTGGSSGGPWFIGTSPSGYQNSVNSYGYGTNKMYGPYWGSVIESTYLDAAAA
jgi:V8-like Glu-specific endopeptidase